MVRWRVWCGEVEGLMGCGEEKWWVEVGLGTFRTDRPSHIDHLILTD